MARTPFCTLYGAHVPAAARSVPVTAPGGGARVFPRFAVPLLMRRALARVIVVGGLTLVGWLATALFGLLGLSSAAAESTVVPQEASRADRFEAAAGLVVFSADGFPTARGDSASVRGRATRGSTWRVDMSDGSPVVPDDAEAMAGRGVDGLTSQSEPLLPAPITADLGADGVMPHGGGIGQFGPGAGDVARSIFDPRLAVRRVPLASVPLPVVRTAADEPSYTPD